MVLKNSRHLLTILSLLLLTAILVVICYFWLDRQLVWWLVAHDTRRYSLLKILANDITLLLTILIALFYLSFVVKLSLNRLNLFDRKFVIVCNAVVTGQFVKALLEPIFGRYWTGTFICNNPSLLNNHVYGFNWFTTGSAFQSFPSGHTTFIISFSVTLWLLFPCLRWLWALLSALVIVGQLGMYYHFASDIFAGVFLGALIAYCHYTYHHSRLTKPSNRN